MKKTISLLLSLILLAGIVLAGCSRPTEPAKPTEATEPAEAPAITSGAVPLYLEEASNQEEITLYYKDGLTEIPYLDLETVRYLLLKVMEFVNDPGYELTLTWEGQTAVYSRENGSRLEIDFASHTFYWEDYDRFTARSYAQTLLDILVNTGYDEAGKPYLFQRNSVSVHRGGDPLLIRLEDYGIGLLYEDGQGYLPLSTASDLILGYKFWNLGYNGQAVFLIGEEGFGEPLLELYHDVEPRPRSQALIDYNYAELLLCLDFHYGLRKEQNIPDFEALLARTGLEERLRSPDAQEANIALADFICSELDDLHSSFQVSSPYAGTAKISPTSIGWSTRKNRSDMNRFRNAAWAAFPDGVNFYQEIGNTAFVTFNSFQIDFDADYYARQAAGDPVPDTLGIIMYAHSKITRENSPIENVVLDLSLNLGGWEDAAVFAIAWFLGDGIIHSENAATGAQASMSYSIDTNGDGSFDLTDTVYHLNRYCLVSPVSFSCGNLVPVAFKNSGQVTLLGRQTGGGACIVQPIISPDGTYWKTSSQLLLCEVDNGSYYHVDRGVAPDFIIDKLEHFYDREALTDYINQLY